MEKVLTVKDVLERYKISEPTFYRMLRNKTAPPSFMVGNQHRFREEDLKAWEEKNVR